MYSKDSNLIKTRIGREEIYSGRACQLWIDELRLPSGGTVKREHLHHPRSVAVFALDAQDRCVLVRQYRYTLEKLTLEIPAGKMDKGDSETPLQAIQRELKEETGYTASEWISLGEIYPTTGIMDEIIYLYLARGLSSGEQALSDFELINVERVSLDALRRMIDDGTINDGKTLCAYARAQIKGLIS